MISISCPSISHSRKCKHNIACVKAQYICLLAPRNMLFLLSERIDAQMSPKMPIAWNGCQNQCSEQNIRVFQMKSEWGPCSNSEINLVIHPSELIKKHAHKCPISGADHVHDKMFKPQTTPLGSSHTHVITRKACYTMFILNRILFHVHGCANSCHEISSTLSMDNGSMHTSAPFLGLTMSMTKCLNRKQLLWGAHILT